MAKPWQLGERDGLGKVPSMSFDFDPQIVAEP